METISREFQSRDEPEVRLKSIRRKARAFTKAARKAMKEQAEKEEQLSTDRLKINADRLKDKLRKVEEKWLDTKLQLADLHFRQLMETMAKQICNMHIETSASCLSAVQEGGQQSPSYRIILQHAGGLDCSCSGSNKMLTDLEVDSHLEPLVYKELSKVLHELGYDGHRVVYLLKDTTSGLIEALRHAMRVVEHVAVKEKLIVQRV